MISEIVLHVEEIPHLEGSTVLHLRGQLDETNLDRFRDMMEDELLPSDARYLVLNMQDLEFLNSKVIGYLASLYGSVAERGKKVMITNPRPSVHDVLELVGLTTLITHYMSLEEAYEAILAHNTN